MSTRERFVGLDVHKDSLHVVVAGCEGEVRELGRMCSDAVDDLTRVKQRLKSFWLRLGYHYTGTASWNGAAALSAFADDAAFLECGGLAPLCWPRLGADGEPRLAWKSGAEAPQSIIGFG